MVFSSLPFLFLYFTVTLLLYAVTPARFRNFTLLVTSLAFYGWSEPRYIWIMIFSILVDYTLGRMVWKYIDNRKKARIFVALSACINLSILFTFKYLDFFIGTANSIFGSEIPLLSLALPVGISFYTFQTMSYTIDVYRGDAPVQRDIVAFGSYVTLFPQLIAGPIIRYKDLADQLKGRSHSREKFASGASRFVCGMAKKVLLANNIGTLWDTVIAGDLAATPALTAWLGALGFAFQIYFDFSGYSDMAIGIGRMLGFDFIENFNYPYISRSITEFWRRWHMSLGTWFREYVYIPLGGNRGGMFKMCRNILVVWALTGFWHGASWNFLLWGLYFGLLLLFEKLVLMPHLKKHPTLAHVYTCFLLLCGWVIFNVTDMAQMGQFFRAMFGLGGGLVSAGTGYLLRSYGISLVIMAVASTPLPGKLYNKFVAKAPWLQPLLAALGLVLSTAYLVNASYNPFLYFRF